MNKISRMAGKLLRAAQIIGITLLVGCGSALPSTVCHATGNSADPYKKITVTSADLRVHMGHPDDLMPAPVGGCPTRPVAINDGKITICHLTGSQTRSYNEITVAVNGLNGHGTHDGDIIPAPDAGCPASQITPAASNEARVTICHATGSKTHPYNEITVSVNGLNGHNKHAGDIIPAPAGGCPVTRP